MRHPDEKYLELRNNANLFRHFNTFVHGVVDTVIWFADKGKL